MHGSSVISCAAITGDDYSVMLLLSKETIEVKSDNGADLLYFYLSKKLFNIANLLIQKGAPMRANSFRLITDLSEEKRAQLEAYSCSQEFIDTVRFTTDLDHARRLLDNGAKVNAICRENRLEGSTALSYVADTGCLAMAKFLIASGASLEDIETSSTNDKLASLLELYETFSSDLTTSLYPSESIAKTLNKGIINPNARFGSGKTALHLIVSSSKEEDEMLKIVKALVIAGATVEAKDDESETVLYAAAKNTYCHKIIVRWLLTFGADKEAAKKCARREIKEYIRTRALRLLEEEALDESTTSKE